MGRVNPCSHPHGFAQSHIGERCLPPLLYKHLTWEMMYYSVCDVSKFQKLRIHTLCTPSLRLNAIKAEGGRWGFPLKPQKTPFCGRKLSLKPQLGIVCFGIGRVNPMVHPKFPSTNMFYYVCCNLRNQNFSILQKFDPFFLFYKNYSYN